MTLEEYRFLDRLRELPFVEAIYLFGSRARSEAAPRSDVDLAVLCPSATPDEWLEVIEIVEEADTLLDIDCVRLDGLRDDDRLKEKILREGKELYRKGGADDA